MKLFTLTFLSLFFVTLLSAAPRYFRELNTSDETYRNVRVISVKPDAITIQHADGLAKVPMESLSPRLRADFDYDPQAHAAYEEERALAKEAHKKMRQAEAISQPKSVRARVKRSPSSYSILDVFGTAPRIEEEVDLRPELVELGLFSSKNQGRRPSCSVFSVVSALEYQNAKATGLANRFSEEYLIWATFNNLGYGVEKLDSSFYEADLTQGYPDTGFFIGHVLQALQRYGVPFKEDMPYTFGPDYANLEVPSEAIIEKAKDNIAIIKPHRVFGKDRDTQIDNIIHALNQGVPVVVGLKFPNTAYLRRVHLLKSQDVSGNHAVTLMGYQAPGGRRENMVFIFKNSWGPRWGLGGYGFVHYEYMRKYLLDAYVIEVKPAA